MPLHIVYSERARQSLLGIALYLAGRDPEAAVRLVDGVERRLNDVLAVFPEAGPRAGDGRRI